MSNVAINIAAEFTGKPAFKKAETSVTQLDKRTKNLGKTLTRTFGTAAVLAFGRASVRAFAEDDKAAASLGQTLKNLNLAYGANIGTVNGYISRLEQQTGVLDDELRPAMDRFLRATGSVTKSQELLNLALDVAAGTGKSVTQVSQSLQKAYLGQTQAIGRLGVGLTKAEIASSSFEEIQQRLTTLFAGQAAAAADTFAGQLDKLTIAANNAKETIGAGLYDAITALSGGGTTAATDNIDKLAKGIADSLKNAGEFVNRLEKLKPVLIAFGIAAAAAFLPVTTAIAGVIFLIGDLNKRLNELSFRKGIIPGGMGNISMTVSSQDTQRADAAAKKAAADLAKLTKDQANNQSKILKDKRLAAAIDKANAALNKGQDVFDLEKIQVAAALKNQAEQLGKATSSAQQIQIANDVARLNVKKSIFELEEAIASKDEAAIIAATAKLNADLKILGALTGQQAKIIDIKSLLDSLKPVDLINTKNLEDALAKLGKIISEMRFASGGFGYYVPPRSGSLGSGIPAGDYIEPVDPKVAAKAKISSILEYSAAATERANAFAYLTDLQNEYLAQTLAESSLMNGSLPATLNLEDVARSSLLAGLSGGAGVAGAVSGSRYAAQAAAQYNITIQANTIANPDELTNLIQDSLIKINRQGGSLLQAGSL
jgi:hypothetical protein